MFRLYWGSREFLLSLRVRKLFYQLSVEVQQDQGIRMRIALGVYIIADEDLLRIL